MSDAAQGAIMLGSFFVLVVAAGWVMRGRLGEVEANRQGADELMPREDREAALSGHRRRAA